MKFCPACDNMLYITMDDDGKAVRYECKHSACAYTVKGEGAEIIAETSRANDSAKYSQYMTAHIAHDPTLPRTRAVKCPNPDCPAVTQGKSSDKSSDKVSDKSSDKSSDKVSDKSSDKISDKSSDKRPDDSRKNQRKGDEIDDRVIYVKYDAEDVRFLYHCCACKTFWKTASRDA
jgi:DNA-directed RNA polymerase subunit M/transcription elongation factor TFIIS